MEELLSIEQEELLKRTRDILGQVRDALATVKASTADREALVESIKQLDELFLLVIAGEFNSGKSSFINALLGQKLQREGVTPTTDQIHLLKYGPPNDPTPGERGVWVQTAPLPLLKKISIVDTPGTNAIVREHEALTAEFIPRSDLVLFITSADRPFTESERNFLSQIEAWGKKVVLVINKIDILADEDAVREVVTFVMSSAARLLGDNPPVFPLSAKQAQQAKEGQPRLWDVSRFEALENYVKQTLDDNGRFKLKLLNPLGVGLRLVKHHLDIVEADLVSLEEDQRLISDIDGQMTYYNEDMQRNFKARLGEIDNVLYAMEKRGNDFFDEMLRVGRIADLMRSKQLEKMFEERVVANTPDDIESRVGELVDWMVEQDLRQWTATADHLAKRRDVYAERIVGDGGPREGTLAYDRQRLIDSIGRTTRQAVASYDKDLEAEKMANVARSAVVNTGLAGVGVGVGVAVAIIAHTAFLDYTGIFTGITAATLGLLILPTRRRKARKELAEKLAEVRSKLVTSLTEQFEREMRRSAQRIGDTVSPFTRFVRSEQDKMEAQRDQLEELEAHMIGLQQHLEMEPVEA